MPSDHVELRSAILVVAAVVGVGVGIFAGHGCQQTQLRKPADQPLPMTGGHLTPRVVTPEFPPEAVRHPERSAAAYPDRPLAPTAEPNLRIRIAALRDGKAAPRFTHATKRLVLLANGRERSLRAPVQVRMTAQGFAITEEAGTARANTVQVAGRAPIEFRSPGGTAGTVTYDGTEWPSQVRLVPLAESPHAVDLVVDVPLERYLPGVLARELYRNWSLETFRAQAIAARSFAICEHAQWAGRRHYDLVAGEASQAWVGEVKELRPRAAVADTRGMLLLYDDRVVPAYYSSTCGGTPANAVDALTRNPYHSIAPLLAGAEPANAHRNCCRFAPKFRWEQTIPVGRVLAQLQRWSTDYLAQQNKRGPQVARAEQHPTAAAPGEPKPLVLRAESPVSAASLGGAHASAAIEDGASAPARVGTEPEEWPEDVPLAELARLSGLQSIEVLEANQAGRPVRVRLVDVYGTTIVMRAEDFRRAVNYAPVGEATPHERLNSSNFRAEVKGASIHFRGSGFGHGVGMCQFGAEAMAQKGASAEQILHTYYPGATIRRAY